MDFALKLNDPKIPLIIKSGILCTSVNFEFGVNSQFNVKAWMLNSTCYITIWTTLGTPNQKELQRVPRTLSSVHRKNGPQGG